MKKLAAFLLVLIIVACAGWWAYQNKERFLYSQSDLGTYAYECDEHVGFTIKPSHDLLTLRIAPTHGTYPPAATLTRQVTIAGERFEGEGVVFVAHGESVILGEGDNAINCSPVASDTEAPFNFGD